MTRALAERIRKLRARGLTAWEIGDKVGLPGSTIRNWWGDDTCVDCGAPIDASGRQRPGKRCAGCDMVYRSTEEARLAQTYWTRERIVAAVRWWEAVHGEPPAAPDWNPTLARDVLGDLPRAKRGQSLISRRVVPHTTSVFFHFGSWNAAIAAAGFEPRVPNGGNGNILRRRDLRAKAAA